ncbi:MAG: hypothetical protein WAL67_15225, partial [Candidatus Cybelea sp.]
MKNPHLIAALAVVLAATGTAIATAKLMPDVVDQPTRFSGSCCIFTGAPSLALTLSMVEAGGGPSSFNTVTLLKTLT